VQSRAISRRAIDFSLRGYGGTGAATEKETNAQEQDETKK
jgi:hypothetical protein